MALDTVSGMVDGIPTADQINAMSDGEYKVYENRLRRMAERQGLRLEKARRRDTRAQDWCTYRLMDPSTHTVVSHNPAFGTYGLSLDQVERVLLGEISRAAAPTYFEYLHRRSVGSGVAR
ncbi:MAG: hypothetical protein ACT4NY_08830 [Pseudonocardiales bacterium]